LGATYVESKPYDLSCRTLEPFSAKAVGKLYIRARNQISGIYFWHPLAALQAAFVERNTDV
jgi:hypothetical protein